VDHGGENWEKDKGGVYYLWSKQLVFGKERRKWEQSAASKYTKLQWLGVFTTNRNNTWKGIGVEKNAQGKTSMGATGKERECPSGGQLQSERGLAT